MRSSHSSCSPRRLFSLTAVGAFAVVVWLLLVAPAGVAQAQFDEIGEIIARILQLLTALFGDLLGPVLAFLRELFGAGPASP